MGRCTASIAIQAALVEQHMHGDELDTLKDALASADCYPTSGQWIELCGRLHAAS